MAKIITSIPSSSSSVSNTSQLINDGADGINPFITALDILNVDKNFVYTQNIPSTVWTISHMLNKFPSVMVMDSAGTVVIGEINYQNINNITLTFSAAFSGKATLN
jgi:hypothetical protein